MRGERRETQREKWEERGVCERKREREITGVSSSSSGPTFMNSLI
jgi:hypothetical protein